MKYHTSLARIRQLWFGCYLVSSKGISIGKSGEIEIANLPGNSEVFIDIFAY